MNKIILGILSIITVISIESCCFSGCPDDNGDPFGSIYEPILMDRAVFEESVTIADAQSIEASGKIYVYGEKLFVNEKLEGFHIFNNQNPSNPINSNFLAAPGATDVSIIDDVLYINQATDLIAVTINPETNTASVTKRIVNTFPPLAAPDGSNAYDIPENSVIIGWLNKLED